MVKRIKKRIPKQEAVEETSEELNGSAEEFAPAEPAQTMHGELASLANDSFTESAVRILQWILDHKVGLIVTAATVLVAVFAFSKVQSVMQSGREEATKTLVAASAAYADSKVATAEDGTAIDTAAALQKAQAAFEKGAADYKGKKIEPLFVMGLASTAFDQGKYEDALAKYDAILAVKGDMDRMVTALAWQGKAACEESLNKIEDAQNSWQSLADLNPEVFGLMGDMQIARLLETQGKKDEAKTKYQQILENHAETLELLGQRATKAEVERRLTLLGSAT